MADGASEANPLGHVGLRRLHFLLLVTLLVGKPASPKEPRDIKWLRPKLAVPRGVEPPTFGLGNRFVPRFVNDLRPDVADVLHLFPQR